MAFSLFGAWSYIRDTLRGETSPNRVTWSLWGLEGILAFAVEVQQHVGLASLMTLILGLVPCAVVAVSFRNPHRAWRIDAFDAFCGALSLLGVVFWAFVHEPTVALVSFVAADQLAALPTVRKSWRAPSTETARAFAMGTLNTAITLMTLRELTTAGALFPGAIMVTDLVIAVLVSFKMGPRWRKELPVRVVEVM